MSTNRFEPLPIESSGDACLPRPSLAHRPLLGFVEAVQVMALFKVLSNDTRIRILHHIIRSGEATVTDIAKTLGMKPQAVSNQLMRLSDTRMLASRRDGIHVFYRVENCCVAPLLDLALCLMENGAQERPAKEMKMNDPIEKAVRQKYGAVAASTLSNQHEGVRGVAEAFGYTAEELASIPAEANMGLSCGNPTATANLRPGEVVVDLGCGGGLDVFLAANKVGPAGRAIGIDMTPEMLARARQNASRQGLENVEFHEANIEKLPLSDGSVDCVISNCVINLATDKQAVFREIARVLKPGGRVAVSDIALKKPLPPELGNDMLAYVGCIAGAISIDDYVAGLKSAGFADVQVIDTKKDLNAYAKVENQAACCAPPALAPASGLELIGESCCSSEKSVHEDLVELLKKYDVNDYAASVQVFAIKP